MATRPVVVINHATDPLALEIVTLLDEAADLQLDLRLCTDEPRALASGYAHYAGRDVAFVRRTPQALAGARLALLGDETGVEPATTRITLLGERPTPGATVALLEVDPDALDEATRHIEVPDGVSTALALIAEALSPSIKRIGGTVLEPVASRGPKALEELYEQTRALFARTELPTEILGDRLAFNVLAQPDRTLDLAAVLGGAPPVALRRLLVPVFGGTTLALELVVGPLSSAQAQAKLAAQEGLAIDDAPSPASAVGTDAVQVLAPGDGDKRGEILRVYAVVDEVRRTAKNFVDVIRAVLAQET